MDRINIIGCSGSGKSTFGRKLSSILDIKYYELDSLFWKPNWEQTDKDDFFDKAKSIVNTESWVIDGNYRRIEQIKFNRADTIIWIDTPFYLTMIQAFKRAIRRIKNKEELWEGTGNRETIRKTFFSKNSILLWTMTNYRRINKRYTDLFKSGRYEDTSRIRLKTRKEKELFLKKLEVEICES